MNMHPNNTGKELEKRIEELEKRINFLECALKESLERDINNIKHALTIAKRVVIIEKVISCASSPQEQGINELV